MSKQMQCIICGCTNDRACRGGCHWVAPNLCSNCENSPELQNPVKEKIYTDSFCDEEGGIPCECHWKDENKLQNPMHEEETWEERFKKGWDRITDNDSVNQIRKEFVVDFIKQEFMRERSKVAEELWAKFDKELETARREGFDKGYQEGRDRASCKVD